MTTSVVVISGGGHLQHRHGCTRSAFCNYAIRQQVQLHAGVLGMYSWLWCWLIDAWHPLNDIVYRSYGARRRRAVNWQTAPTVKRRLQQRTHQRVDIVDFLSMSYLHDHGEKHDYYGVDPMISWRPELNSTSTGGDIRVPFLPAAPPPP